MIVNGSKGSAIIGVLLVLLVLTVLGVTLFNMDLININIVSSDKLYQAAYYYAEAGLMHQTEAMCQNMEELYKGSESRNRNAFLYSMQRTPINPPQFGDYQGHNIKVTITCKKKDLPLINDEFIIISTCKIGKITRSIKATICTIWSDPSDEDFRLDHSTFSIIGWEEI